MGFNSGFKGLITTMITDVALRSLCLVCHLSVRLLVLHQNSATIGPLDLIFTQIAKNVMVLEITESSYLPVAYFLCYYTEGRTKSRH